jgi:dienelactone hydrolase
MSPGLRRLVRAAAFVIAIFVAAGAVIGPGAGPAAAQPSVHTGRLPNGATWRAEVPPNWNGTLLLYSHGYVPSFLGLPNPARVAPDAATGSALLAEGYALAGSSYATVGWALNTAVRDQLDTLTAAAGALGRRPDRVLAYGTSMGGLVTAKLAEAGGGRIHGAMPTCGIVGGGIALGNYQLDGSHAIDELLLPDRTVKLVRFASAQEAFGSAEALVGAITAAQLTPQGRARIALAAALFHAPSWRPGQAAPPPGDAAAIERGQQAWLTELLPFVTPGRFDAETASGGNPSWNAGVNYARLLRESSDAWVVRELYEQAGLDLRADLAQLTATARVRADAHAVARASATSVPTGETPVPVLTIHTTADHLVPVQHENAYGDEVRGEGRGALLRRAYVARPGHCTFTPAELVAGVHALAGRVVTGRWGDSATAASLQREAARLGLGDAAFVRYRPGELLRSGFELPAVERRAA